MKASKSISYHILLFLAGMIFLPACTESVNSDVDNIQTDLIENISEYKTSKEAPGLNSGEESNENYYQASLNQLEERQRLSQKRERFSLYALFLFSIMGLTITALIYYAYRQRTRSNKILRDLESMRSNFFEGITHEFKAPLTVILGMTDRIKESGDNVADAKIIERQGNILLDMVNQLNEIARIKTRPDKSIWITDDIIAFANMCTETFKRHTSEQRKDLVFQSAERSLEVDFVPDYMEKIIRNVLSNSLKHTPEGGKISVDIFREQENLKMIFSDSGKGIAEQDLPHIFEEFYIGGSREHSEYGIGMGLALVKKMVEAMNGTIYARNAVGSGAELILTMPLKQKFTSEIRRINKKEIEFTPKSATIIGNDNLAGAEAMQDAQSPGKDCILIVEDNIDVQNYIGSLLEADYSVRYASDGIEGLNKAEDFIPDLIITDMMMPELDGINLIREIRNNDILSHIPIVALSAKTSNADKREALEAGAEVFLEKPFYADELRLRVGKLLEQRRLLREKFSVALANGSTEKVELSASDRNFLNKVESIIQENISDPDLNPDKLAAEIFKSRSQLNRKIKQISDYSASAFIMQIRLEKSSQLLRDDEKLISEIALECGFDDPNYFSRAFKRTYKMSPSQFRKNSL